MKKLLTKYQIFIKLPQISQKIFTKIVFKLKSFKYDWNFLDKLLLPYKCYGRNMRGIFLFIFASREPLTSRLVKSLPYITFFSDLMQ